MHVLQKSRNCYRNSAEKSRQTQIDHQPWVANIEVEDVMMMVVVVSLFFEGLR